MLGTRIDLNTGRYISIGRFALALTMLAVAISDPEGVGVSNERDDAVAFAAVTGSLVLMGFCCRSWWWQFRLRHVETAFDMALVLGIMFSFDSTALGKHGLEVLALTMVATRMVIIIGLRAMQALFAAYLLLFMILAIVPLGSHPEVHPDFLVLRVVAIVFLIATILSLFASNRTVSPIVTPPRPEGLELTEFLAATNRAARSAMQGRQSVIAWHGGEVRPMLAAGLAGNEEVRAERLDIWPFPSLDRSQVAALLHDLRKSRAVVLYRDGTSRRLAHCPVTPGSLDRMEHLGGAIAAAPMHGASGEGLLLVSAKPSMHPISLESIAAMAGTVTDAIERNALTRADREADLLALRQSVALDLHDSVAQALTGTRFWLNSIVRRLAEAPDKAPAPDIAERIATLSDSIAFEQTHVNSIIARLREGEDDQAFDLRAELPGLATKLAARWQVEVDLELGDGVALVPAADGHEIKHLLREAIANAVRHGKASRIEIEIVKADGLMTVAVTDNGRGFANLDAAQEPWSIATRLAQMGGELNLASAAAGTRIEMTIPCRSN